MTYKCIVLALACLVGPFRPAIAAVNSADTLYTESRAMDIYISNPEGALNIIDSAVIVGNITEIRADYLRGCVYYMDESTSVEAETVFERLRRYDDEKQLEITDRLDIYTLLMYAAKKNGDYGSMLHYTVGITELEHGLGHPVNACKMRAESGYAMLKLGDNKGLAMLDDAIAELEGMHSYSALDASLVALKLKLHYFDDAGMPEGIVSIGEQMLRKLKDFDSNPEDYIKEDEAEYMGSPESQAQFIDFYRTQAYAFLACGYTGMGDMAKGRRFAELFDGTKSKKMLSQRKLMLDAWLGLGEYDRFKETAAELRETWGPDTLSNDYATLLKMEAQYEEMMGDLKESLSCLTRYNDVCDFIHIRQNKAEAARYAAIYNVRENEMARHNAELKLQRNKIFTVSLILLVLIGGWFSIYFLRKRIETNRMNRVLTEQITEAMRYKDKYYEEAAKAVQEKSLKEGTDKFSDQELFDILSGAIISEQLFLDSGFGRQSLIDRFSVTKEDIGKAFSSAGTNLPAFINECRLEYACYLLKERPDLTIDDIAKAAGYSLRTSFSRSFKAKYAINPSDYRQQSQ